MGKIIRYLYMTLSEDPTREIFKKGSTGLGKFDMLTKQLKTWHQTGCSAVEPIFVPSPHAKNEDEGVILLSSMMQRKNVPFYWH